MPFQVEMPDITKAGEEIGVHPGDIGPRLMAEEIKVTSIARTSAGKLMLRVAGDPDTMETIKDRILSAFPEAEEPDIAIHQEREEPEVS